MKVLVTTPHLAKSGGVSSYCATLRTHFRCEVEYLAVGAVPVKETWGRRLYRLLTDYWRFYHTLRSGQHDIVQLNPSLAPRAIVRDGGNLLIAKLLGRKTLVFVHGWDVRCEQMIRRRFQRLFRTVYFRSDAIAVLAHQFRDRLRDLGYRRPIYLETAVIADDIFSFRKGRDPERESEGKPFNILFLSRLERAKGLYEAVEAYRIIKEREPRVTMTVAGDGPERAQIEKYVQARGIRGIEFPGWVTGRAKDALFRGAAVFLLPSYSEGMPICVLEAMGYGLPVVTRPVGGLCDFFEDGKMGAVIDSLDPRDFASALGALVDDRDGQVRIGRYNREYSRKRFMASEVAARLEGIYRAIAEGEPSVSRSGGPSMRACTETVGESLARAAGDPSDLAEK
ncbi:MAG: glycosyltransferase family 4 protein [Planctomycetota bacterium]|jgi:glycosyltransferase involved in cell wall biosynthesis